jgi:DNA transformation protein
MANTPSFVQHATDLLGLVAPVQARAMFGGHGLYARGVMFALLDDDELFLKVDAQSLKRFEAAGCRRWVYQSPKGPMPTSYYRPPDDAHENPEAMLPWGSLALEAALRAKASKTGRSRPPRAAPARTATKPGGSGPRRRGSPARAARRPR